MVFEALDMLPQSMNARNFSVYLCVFAHALHDLLACGLLEVDGLTVALHDRVLGRLQGWRKSKHALLKQNTFLHVSGGEHGTNTFCYRVVGHKEPGKSGFFCREMMAYKRV